MKICPRSILHQHLVFVALTCLSSTTQIKKYMNRLIKYSIGCMEPATYAQHFRLAIVRSIRSSIPYPEETVVISNIRPMRFLELDILRVLSNTTSFNQYVLILMWSIQKTIMKITVFDMARAPAMYDFVYNWAAIFGTESHFLSKHRHQSESNIFSAFCVCLGIEHATTDIYHRQLIGARDSTKWFLSASRYRGRTLHRLGSLCSATKVRGEPSTELFDIKYSGLRHVVTFTNE